MKIFSAVFNLFCMSKIDETIIEKMLSFTSEDDEEQWIIQK